MKHLLKIVFLYPLSLLYGLGVGVRNKLFDWGIIRQQRFNFPIISIGNITVGGTGKTPLTEYLVALLNAEGVNAAVLSRGYKRKTKGFVLADAKSTAADIGDEPFQIKKKFPKLTVAVDAKRFRAINTLSSSDNPPQAYVLDDAFQHRYIEAGLSILLIDYNRLIYNDHLLPFGHLREPANQRYRADVWIVTKCPKTLRPIDMRIIDKHLQMSPTQRLYFSSFEYGTIYNLADNKKRYTVEDLKRNNTSILIVTGVVSPEPLYRYIETNVGSYDTVRFADHHAFTKKDWERIEHKFDRLPNQKKIILLTEKDAARVYADPNVPQNLRNALYTIPIQVTFLGEKSEENFKNQIIDYVRKNKRNGRFS